MAEFLLLSSDTVFDGGKFRHALFHIGDGKGNTAWRAVIFRELTYLPIQERDDPDLMGKQWLALRGLYNAGVDFTYTAMGVYRPKRVGVVQFYGAAAESWSRDEAIAEAERRMLAVESVLANYPQSRLDVPNPERIQWMVDRIKKLPRILAILGHPDPRLAKKGLGRDGSLGEADDELMSQQGENLLRGLAKIGEDFVFLVTAAHLDRERLAHAFAKMSRVASQYASRQRGNIGIGFSIAIPLAAALADSYGGSQGGSHSTAHSTADSVGRSWGHTQAHGWSHQVSHQHSVSDSHSEGGMVGGSTTVTHGVGHTTSHAVTDGAAHTTSHSHGVAHSSGTTWSHTDSSSTTHTSGVNQPAPTHTDSGGSSRSSSVSLGNTGSHATTTQQSHTDSSGHQWSASMSGSHSTSSGTTDADSSSSAVTQSSSVSDMSGKSGGASWKGGGNLGVALSPMGVGVKGGLNSAIGVNGGVQSSHTHTQGGASTMSTSTSHAVQTGHSDASGYSLTGGTSSGHADTVGSSTTSGHSTSTSVSMGSATQKGHADTHPTGTGWSQSTSVQTGHSDTHGGFQSTTHSESWGTADTKSHSVTNGHADSVQDSVSHTSSWASTWSDTHTEGNSAGESWGESRSEAVSEQRSRAHALAMAEGDATAVSGAKGFVGGLAGSIIPGFSITRGWQTEDDLARRVTEITRGLESLLNQASLEGGFMTTALLFTDERGERAAESLIPQSFHGPNVPTPVLTVPGDEDLRINALAFRPSLAPDGDPFDADLWTKWGTLLTPGMLAAYTAPNLFEEGTAATTQEEIPEVAFYPEMDGDVELAYQISRETGDVTNVPLKLSRDRHFHTAFTGDTGYGKTVAAIRMVYETTLKWKMTSVVLDFGAGWRRLLDAPGLEGHVEIRQLSPGGVRPLRWNPLQLGRRLLPEFQWRAFADVFGNVAALGKKQQIHEMRDAVYELYLKFGALTDDELVLDDPLWGKVQKDEEAIAHAKEGTPLRSLPRDALQEIAVFRSRKVGLKDLYQLIEEKERPLPAKDIRKGILSSIRARLHPLVQGAAAKQYGPGDDAVDITSIVPGDWGVAILEGGMFLDEFSKAFLLGWIAWHIFYDAVMKRLRSASAPKKYMQIVFEEANKILSGVSDDGEEAKGPASTTEQFASMWRDSRKYGIWLHVITQTPQRIPKGILSSCNNIFSAMLKDPKDRDLVVAELAKSEKGFRDEKWRRFLAEIPRHKMVARLAYSTERAFLQPVYVQPIYLDAPEPSDEEIERKLGRIDL